MKKIKSKYIKSVLHFFLSPFHLIPHVLLLKFFHTFPLFPHLVSHPTLTAAPLAQYPNPPLFTFCAAIRTDPPLCRRQGPSPVVPVRECESTHEFLQARETDDDPGSVYRCSLHLFPQGVRKPVPQDRQPQGG